MPDPHAPPAATTKATSAASGSGLFSPRTVELVQKSWGAVMPISEVAAKLFYDRLFELDPTVRPLFKPDLRDQKKKLMQTLAVAVDGLTNPAKLVPVLESLGARHAGYRVVDRHYDLVGAALLWTLREGLGEAFTVEVEQAWTEVYTVIADVMKRASAQAAPAPKPASALGFGQIGGPRPKEPAPAARTAVPGPIVKRGVVVPAPSASAIYEISPDSAPIAGRTLVGLAEPGATDQPLSKHTVELVQRSWAVVMPIADAASLLFYDRLFELDPTLKPMFKSDIREQRKKLMQTLGVAVDGLSNLAKLIPVLQNLGVRHAGYRVLDRHYDLVGEALLWTLREGLNDAFTAEIEVAWTEVYTLIAGVMKQAAAEHGSAHDEAASPASTPTIRERASSPSMDDDAATLQYDPIQLPHDGTRPAASPSAVEPSFAHEQFSLVDSTRSPRVAIRAPSVETPVPRGVTLPASGQEMTVKLTVKLDSPLVLPAQEPRAAESTSPGLALGLALATMCMLASMGVAGAFALGASRPGEAPHLAILVGVPVALLVLTLAAFGLGYAWGKGRTPAPVANQPPR